MATFAAYENVAVHICTCRPCNAWLMLCYRIMLQTLLFYLLLISALALPAFRLPPMRAIPTDNTLKIQEPPSVYLKMRKCQFLNEKRKKKMKKKTIFLVFKIS